MITQNYFTLPFYVPRICRLWINWPEYLLNYVLRRSRPTEYRMRSGFRLIDETGRLPGTLAEVFVRRRYGSVARFRTLRHRLMPAIASSTAQTAAVSSSAWPVESAAR